MANENKAFDTVCSKHREIKGKTLKKSVTEEIKELFYHVVCGGTMAILPKDSFPLYSVSVQLLQQLGISYSEFVQRYGQNTLLMLHPEDRERYTAAIQNSLSTGEIFDQIIRIKPDAEKLFLMRDIGKPIQTEDGASLMVILRCDETADLNYHKELEFAAKRYEEKSKQLEALTATIPGGVCEVDVDENFTLVYGNDGFFKLYGYTPEQFEEEHKNRLLNVVYEQDKKRIKECIDQAYAHQKSGFEFEHRITKRNGSIFWALVRGNFTVSRGKPTISCAVIDINERKRIEEEAKINEKRFKIALAQTENTIFEYDVQTKVMIHGDRSAEQYGLEHITENVPQSLLDNGVVHPDSGEAFLDLYKSIAAGAPTANCIIRAKHANNGYVWRRITMTTIYDEMGNAIQAVGVLEDIDEQIKREEILRYESERDELTGLYNRRAIPTYIKMELESDEEKIGALFIIDLDAFKSVNDCYGHMFGDFVLKESAKRITEIFHGEESVAARIGGDEFIVYVYGRDIKQKIKVFSERLSREFSRPFFDGEHSVDTTCSAGVALLPRHGRDFEELYRKADLALYRAKNNGKNQVIVFRSYMGK